MTLFYILSTNCLGEIQTLFFESMCFYMCRFAHSPYATETYKAPACIWVFDTKTDYGPKAIALGELEMLRLLYKLGQDWWL